MGGLIGARLGSGVCKEWVGQAFGGENDNGNGNESSKQLFLGYASYPPSLAQTFVLNRCTTGTELGGKLPYSVITILMYCAGVTS